MLVILTYTNCVEILSWDIYPPSTIVCCITTPSPAYTLSILSNPCHVSSLCPLNTLATHLHSLHIQSLHRSYDTPPSHTLPSIMTSHIYFCCSLLHSLLSQQTILEHFGREDDDGPSTFPTTQKLNDRMARIKSKGGNTNGGDGN